MEKLSESPNKGEIIAWEELIAFEKFNFFFFGITNIRKPFRKLQISNFQNKS